MSVKHRDIKHPFTAATPSSTFTDQPNGTMISNNGAGNVEASQRPINELGTTPNAVLDRLDKFAHYDTSTSSHMAILPEDVLSESNTRANVLALQAASNLIRGRAYCITGFTQGNLSGTVMISAIASNALGQNAILLNTFDNTAWSGIYDIDLNLFQELTDNRGNTIRGSANISSFIWGNTSFSNWTVDFGASFTVTGYTGTANGVSLATGSNLNISNSSVNITNITLDSGASANHSTTTGAISNTKYQRGVVNSTGATNLSIQSSTFGEETSVTINTTTNQSIQFSTIGMGASYTTTGKTGCSLTRTRIDASSVTCGGTATSIILTDCTLSNQCTYNWSAGSTLQQTNFHAVQYSIQKTSGTGFLTYNSGRATNCSITHNGDTGVTFSSSEFDSSSTHTYNAGCGGTENWLFTKMGAFSTYTCNSTATAGTRTHSRCMYFSGTTITESGTGGRTVNRMGCDTIPTINFNGTGTVNTNGDKISNATNLTFNPSGTGTLSSTFNQYLVGAAHNFNPAIAAGITVTITNNVFGGTSSTITFSGNAVNQNFSVQNNEMSSQGRITLLGTLGIILTIAQNTLSGGGNITIAGQTSLLTLTIQYISLTTGSATLAVGVITAAVATTHIIEQSWIAMASTWNISGTLTDGAISRRVRIGPESTLNQTGGSISSATIENGSTVNAGANTHSYISSRGLGTSTLLAANTNRETTNYAGALL